MALMSHLPLLGEMIILKFTTLCPNKQVASLISITGRWNISKATSDLDVNKQCQSIAAIDLVGFSLPISSTTFPASRFQ